MPVPTASPQSKPIIIWCHARSCSTAFERAFMQHPYTRTIHEPFVPLKLFSKTRTFQGFTEEWCRKSPWYDVTRTDVATLLSENKVPYIDEHGNLQSTPAGSKILFIKDMAQNIFRPEAIVAVKPEDPNFKAPEGSHFDVPVDLDGVPENPTYLPVSLLRKFTHTFLIRDPARAIPSHYKASDDLRKEMGTAADPASLITYPELRLFYNFISDPRSEFNTAPREADAQAAHSCPQPYPPPLIDAADLLENPSAILKKYCAAVGLPWDPAILNWKQETIKEFDVPWRAMYRHATASSGFEKDTRTTEEIALAMVESEAQEIQGLIERYRPDYEYLNRHRTLTADSLNELL
ncbi:hypothetical protein SISNIDRAFT_438297 [Sistotremastrum niveocremeum HHB9708]|uniref:P-loop containing nucleoside triphosphate hydrolase protein n=1 Tax=Sistotremastrum niveocremeum HHB9708 TaxID=1314777 RepID=A0A164X948_9AGAM|nr:hypothetical protein SISNIDRAFT_438297 [Sistotremastrum niveocremeum HHB9708]